MYKIIQIFVFCLFLFAFANAQSGVLIPSSISDKPDAKILSLQKMDVDILIDNNHASVKITQIFNSRTAQTLEGKYLFALPDQASIFDFATWDNDLRIPGVMMEKQRANAIYERIKTPQIDPAILQQDEDTSAFSAKVYPITPFGTKRLELEYTEDLPIEAMAMRFSFPLRPTWGESQTADELNIHLRVVNDFPISPIELSGYEMQVLRSEPNEYEAVFNGKIVPLNQDLSLAYKINSTENSLSFLAYKAPERISVYDLQDPKFANPKPDGFFETRAIFNDLNLQTTDNKKFILLLDTSLSMYGDKISKAFEATDFFLHSLKPTDEFNLILFNDETIQFSEKPVFATIENVEKALQFIKNESLGGGTNLKKVLEKGIEQSKYFPLGERNIVLVSDANPTSETTKIKNITKVFDNETTKLYAFALGQEANTSLLEEICQKTKGDFSELRETEDISLALKNFFAKIGAPQIENLRFGSKDDKNFYNVYATEAESENGSSVAFVGRYKSAKQTTVNVLGNYGSTPWKISKEVNLPEFDETHSFLPRLWAKARVDALVQEMNVSGERKDYISEIIYLSQKYKFVTPYTAFIAAPRSLLRPRIIQPGDPVIRLKTDSSITQVYAVLPFGETLPLKYLADEGVWEARFLAPATMTDGSYKCRILLTDKDGNGYQEEKSFIVDAHAPKPKISLEKQTVRAGEEIAVKVQSDKDTAKLVAKFYGAKPVQLLWSNQDKANVGKLKIPNGLSAGKYVLTVTAEDFAHNLSTVEIEVGIL